MSPSPVRAAYAPGKREQYPLNAPTFDCLVAARGITAGAGWAAAPDTDPSRERVAAGLPRIDGQRAFMRFRVTNQVSPIINNLDVRPTQQVFVLQTDHVLSLMKWGLVPAWAKDPSIGSKMINARAEGIESKPSFKKPLRSQRCTIPVSALFEWKGNPGAKAKYRIARKDGDLFGFAGLYDIWHDPTSGNELATCTIITTPPNDLVAPIHNRMPVILLPQDEEHWLDPDLSEPEAIINLLRPYPAELMTVRRTDT